MDYQGASSVLTFSPSVATNDFSVVIVNDGSVEGEEYFMVNLVDNPGLVLADPNLAIVVITEDISDSEFRLMPHLNVIVEIWVRTIYIVGRVRG